MPRSPRLAVSDDESDAENAEGEVHAPQEQDDGSDSDAVPEIREEDNRSATDLDHEPPPPAAGKKRPRKTPDPDDDSEDDPDAIVQPGSMPRRAVSVAREEPEGPVDAFKAAEAARKAGAAAAAGNGNGAAAPPAAAANGGREPLVPKVVDPALRELTLLQSANKASAVGTLPMEALVHGIIQDDEGKTYPPYEITWDEFRVSGVKRRAWLENRLKEDPARVYQTLMIFELADGPRDAASALSRKKMPKFQACLPGKLAGPDVKNTTEQKAKLLSEYVGNDDWNVSIALPADAVAALYKVPSCGLPSELDPNANPDVVYGVIEKMEDYAAKDPRVTIYKVAPDNASGAASGAAAPERRRRSKSRASAGPMRSRPAAAAATPRRGRSARSPTGPPCARSRQPRRRHKRRRPPPRAKPTPRPKPQPRRSRPRTRTRAPGLSGALSWKPTWSSLAVR